MSVELPIDLLDFEGKVVLITGGAVGIGAGLVKELLYHNARHVAFLDVLEREGGALESELLNKFGALRAKFIKCDISDEDQLIAAYSQVLDKYRRLDVVINNAAVISDEGGYKRMVDVNFTATVTSTFKALDVMAVDRGGYGGVILNVSSLLALKPERNVKLPVYAATKTAVLHFSNNIVAQYEYSNTQVRIVTVCLGPTDTALLHRHNFERQDSQNFIQVPEKQRVTSAVNGIMYVIKRAESGSTWVIADDAPPIDVTSIVREGFRSVAAAI